MKKLVSLSTFIFQVAVTFIALIVIYMLYALSDLGEADLMNAIAFFVFQPLYAIILSGLTIAGCLIIGLPLRLIDSLYSWWIAKPLIIVIGLSTALICIAFSFKTSLEATVKVTIDGEETTKLVPNIYLASTGWFLTAFCLLHFYPSHVVEWIRARRLR